MTKKLSLLLLASVTFFISCSDETTVYKDDLNEGVSVENSESLLENSISYDKSGVLDIFEEQEITNKFSKNGEEQAGDYPLTLIAQIKAPSYNGGDVLTASHVHVDGNYAYVSYNRAGEEFLGAVDIINISNPHSPRLTSRLIYTNADLNAVQYEGGYIYAVGGVDAEKSVRATSNSFVAKIPVSGGKLNVDNITYGFQQGFNANDVFVNSAKVFVTSGKDGSLTAYEKSSLEIQDEVPFSDLRSLSLNNGNIAVLDATVGVTIMNSDFGLIKEIPIDTDFGDVSKKTIDFSGDKVIVSEASKGAGVYNYNTGALLEYIPILINPEGVDQSDIVTNAVAANEEVLLMANGGAGLSISEDKGNGADVVGVIELEGSINYVASKGDYIFAASGKEGLQIIKLNRPSESLEAQCASSPAYQGSANLNVNQGDTKAYRGSKRFNNLTVAGNLLLCGSWTVKNVVTIKTNAVFEMNGTFVVGRNHKRKNIVVEEGATLRIEGNLVILGDLILNDGATVEFLGDNSVVNIFGSVKKNGNVTINGTFDDIRNKF